MTILAGKTALVTGASKGIGAGIAEALGRAGARVVVNYSSSREGADAVVGRIKAAGGEAIAIGGSVADEAALENLYAEAKKAYGTLDILVNNAGVFRPTPLGETTAQAYHDHFGVNVFGVVLSTKLFAAQATKGASIINISSIVSRITPPGMGIYNATKGAVDALTRTYAKELGGQGIRVNSINPGLVETEGTVSGGFVGGEMEQAMIAQTPLGRTGKPDDIADVAVFLASEASRWVTGEVISVGGGA